MAESSSPRGDKRPKSEAQGDGAPHGATAPLFPSAFAAVRPSAGPAFAAAAFPGSAASFPSFHSGAGAGGGSSSWLQCSSFKPAPDSDAHAGSGGGAIALQAFRTADFMNDELRDSTFGGRISPGAEQREEKGAGWRVEEGDKGRAAGGRGERVSGERKASHVFRLELSSSESDSEDGGRHKKDRKKDKKHKKRDKGRDKKHGKDKDKDKDKGREREREREKKRKWDDMDEADERRKVTLAELWRDKGNKTTMFFDRVGDKDNVTYGHPAKQETPYFRVDAWWTGGTMRTRKTGQSMLGLRPSRPGAATGGRSAWRYLRPQQAARLRDRHPLREPATPPPADALEPEPATYQPPKSSRMQSI
ncbi:hypothetical protein T484DRAFT_1882936 [Baffinella frigidus]|nr:hypothetical protein T484DRAFT_1882936 [Cryptophyta sp. CCMP2293]